MHYVYIYMDIYKFMGNCHDIHVFYSCCTQVCIHTTIRTIRVGRKPYFLSIFLKINRRGVVSVNF